MTNEKIVMLEGDTAFVIRRHAVHSDLFYVALVHFKQEKMLCELVTEEDLKRIMEAIEQMLEKGERKNEG